PQTDDMREAPARTLIDLLLKSGARVRAYDPVAAAEAQRIYAGVNGFALAKNAYDACGSADALAIVTEWQEFRSPDFERLRELLKAPVIFDGRNLYDPATLSRFGLTYYAVGRGKLPSAACHRPARGKMPPPVILSGGAGTRLGPLSRELYPKQLLPLTGPRTMLQQTVLRLEGLAATAPVVVCNEAHRFLVAEQLRQLKVT